jgi:hypothetical protein
MPLLDPASFDTAVMIWIVLGLAFFVLWLNVTAPYGRHVRPGWGPVMPNRLGWIVMESVSLVLFPLLFLAGPGGKDAAMWIMVAMWTAHYAHRTLVFPLRIRTRNKVMPVVIFGAAVVFNTVNSGLNGYYLGWLSAPYTDAWLRDPRFIIGSALVLAGAAINIWADNRLIGLRSGGETGYAIPRGGLFEYVSCPNHLGEIVEWLGFAILCWNLPALSFAVWTMALLIPRSLAHHRWYRAQFPDYPPRRKAVVPFLL